MAEEKVFLKTIEEVSDALAAGKIIYDKYETKIWKDENGFIICKNKNSNQYIKMGGLYIEDGLYILKPKPLEVKLWHLYEDNKGYKVLIIRKYESKSPFGFTGLGKEIGPLDYDINGISCGASDFNLVKEIADLSQYFEK